MKFHMYANISANSHTIASFGNIIIYTDTMSRTSYIQVPESQFTFVKFTH